MEKYQNKYRIPSARLQNWDYGSNAAYFVTICTANRELFFGDIINGKMSISETGAFASKFLIEIPQRYEYAHLDEFVVMPNHVHAIVIIKKTGIEGGDRDHRGCCRRDAINRVSISQMNIVAYPTFHPTSWVRRGTGENAVFTDSPQISDPG